jgi:hypothetical protein
MKGGAPQATQATSDCVGGMGYLEDGAIGNLELFYLMTLIS